MYCSAHLSATMTGWNWNKGEILACCCLLALFLCAVMTGWNWNKGTILACFSLLAQYLSASISGWNWNEGTILTCCSLLALYLSAIMSAWNWNKRTILACCSLLALYSWLCFHAAYVDASMSVTLPQGFLMRSLVVIFFSPVSVSDVSSVLQTAYDSAASFAKHMVVKLFSFLPCPCPEKGLIIIHSPAFGGRGMFITGGVSTVRRNVS